jgi:beta-phosphoglucomutase-like phosphatase (HAD superfamily)
VFIVIHLCDHVLCRSSLVMSRVETKSVAASTSSSSSLRSLSWRTIGIVTFGTITLVAGLGWWLTRRPRARTSASANNNNTPAPTANNNNSNNRSPTVSSATLQQHQERIRAAEAAADEAIVRALVEISEALHGNGNHGNNNNNGIAAMADNAAADNIDNNMAAIQAVETVHALQNHQIGVQVGTPASLSSHITSINQPLPTRLPVVPPLRAILFDLDGTMADTDHIHADVFTQVLKPYGVACDRDIYKNRISGRSNKLIAQDMVPFLSEREAEALFRGNHNLITVHSGSHLPFPSASHTIFTMQMLIIDKEMKFRELATKITPIAGLLPLINEAKARGIPIRCVTNAPRLNAELMLDCLGLTQYFPPVHSLSQLELIPLSSYYAVIINRRH